MQNVAEWLEVSMPGPLSGALRTQSSKPEPDPHSTTKNPLPPFAWEAPSQSRLRQPLTPEYHASACDTTRSAAALAQASQDSSPYTETASECNGGDSSRPSLSFFDRWGSWVPSPSSFLQPAFAESRLCDGVSHEPGQASGPSLGVRKTHSHDAAELAPFSGVWKQVCLRTISLPTDFPGDLSHT